MGIIDLQNQVDAHKELLEMFAFFLHQDRSSTRKYMILLLNSQNSTFEAFLRHVWDERILDLTVIEWIGEDLEENSNLLRLDKQGDEIYVHVFNPFYDSYSKEELTPEITLFPDKLKNLNGFSINTRLHDVSLMKVNNYEDESNSSSVYLVLGFGARITKAFSDLMNFEPKIRYAVESREVYNGSDGIPLSYKEAYEEGLIDYISRFDSVGIGEQFVLAKKKCYKSLHRDAYITIPIVEARTFLLVEQYNSPKAEVPFTFIITFIVFFIIGSIFLVVAQIFKFDTNNWTILNTMLILVGGPVDAHVPMRVPEKILRISLYIASGLILLIMTDQMMNSLLGHHKFLDLKNIHDLANSGLQLYMTMNVRNLLSSISGIPDLQKSLNRSKIYGEDSDIVNPPLNNNNEFRYAILYPYHSWSGVHHTNEYVERNGNGSNSLLTFINGPLITFPRIIHSNTSPFLLNRFEKITTRLLEAGLLEFWHNHEADDLKISHINFRNEDPGLVGYIHRIYDEPLCTRLGVILMIGYSVASIALIFEIIWKYVGLDTQQSNHLLRMIICGKPDSAHFRLDLETLRTHSMMEEIQGCSRPQSLDAVQTPFNRASEVRDRGSLTTVEILLEHTSNDARVTTRTEFKEQSVSRRMNENRRKGAKVDILSFRNFNQQEFTNMKKRPENRHRIRNLTRSSIEICGEDNMFGERVEYSKI
ncbi:hypothetical protein QAD02_023269 [Eretmocerus hayati]|uniref:Uncharacterized protein n=1 Tax=Eretmocerus hayati TaxID=131215 RepID=A0ACC2PV49_9HYME|nr:hypothetical protein QAD02_023269 [Eretmocerus hayati]